MVSGNKFISVGIQAPTEINTPRGYRTSSGCLLCAGRNGVKICSDSDRNMSACSDQNHAPSLMYVRLNFLIMHFDYMKEKRKVSISLL